MEGEHTTLIETNLCRTCMTNEPNLTSIYSAINIANKSETLISLLSICSEIQVCEADIFPKHICNLCLGKLTNAFLFRELCQKTHKRYQQLYDTDYYKQTIRTNENNYAQDKISDQRNSSNLENESQIVHFGNNNVGDAENFKIHAEANDSNQQFSCKHCGKVFKNKYSLNKHTKVHSDDPKLKCKICLKKFSSLRLLFRVADVKRHMSGHTGEKPFTCSICNISYTQSGSLSSHMKKHDEVHRKISKTDRKIEPKLYLCCICGKSFKQSSTLTIHIRRHIGDKPYICKICQMRFVSSGRLTAHSRTHTGERPFACKTCGKTFAQSSVLAKHKIMHTGKRPYKCDLCLKRFTSLYYLNIHLRNHTGEKPFKCTICLRPFSDPKNLKQHFKSHTDERPHLCGACGKGFKRISHLKCHMKTHNK